ncbi:glycosyltransferase family 1 protein [Longimicrobium sp.]|jgi:glycosyltransferase involved in cell wall biosynthesis|uniref:glycosyltransferase family 4 protein n=1 Tax=Longimicrobium sp. TaxID=2029185 RepID=UPI002ED9074D
MRVVYDVSMLGFGHRHPEARTGVHRVVEHVARGLARVPGLDLAFSATDSLLTHTATAECLSADAQLRTVPLLRPPGARAAGTLEKRARRAAAHAPRSLRARMLGRVVAAMENRHRLPNAGVRWGGEVFHSSFNALPALTGRMRRFLTIYDLIPIRFPQLFEPHMVAWMDRVYGSLRPGDWALAISETTRADLCEYRGFDPARVFVTPLAADARTFYPAGPEEQGAVRRRLGIPEGPYLLTLNTLEPRKNLESVIRAFARVAREPAARDLSLVLVGGRGWKAEGIDAALAEAGPVRERIVLAGYVPDEELAALYSGALAFVYMSLYEGFGLPPLEAMQCGVPVISSNTSSLPEVVGDAGILLPPTDLDAMCQAVLQVHGAPALRAELAARSLARADGFTWERCVAQTVAAYRVALAA